MTHDYTEALQSSLKGLIPASWDLTTVDKIIWVSPDGVSQKVEGVGSYDTPYQSINWALNKAEPGTIVMLKPGVYDQDVNFTKIVSKEAVSGTDKSPILLMSAEGPESVTIGSGSTNFPPISADGSSNIGIIGLTVAANGMPVGKDISGIKIGGHFNGDTPETQHILVANNVVTGSGYDGIKFYAASDVYAVGNTVKGLFSMEAFDNVSVRDAVFAYNKVEGFTGYTGITVKFGSENIEIYGNEFLQYGDRGIQVGGYGRYDGFEGKTPNDYFGFEAKNVHVHDNYINVKPVNFDVSEYALETGLLTADNSNILLELKTGKQLLGVIEGNSNTYMRGGSGIGLLGAHDTVVENNFIDLQKTLIGSFGPGISVGNGSIGASQGGIIDGNKILFTTGKGSVGVDFSKILANVESMGVTLTADNGTDIAWHSLTGPEQVSVLFDHFIKQSLAKALGLDTGDYELPGTDAVIPDTEVVIPGLHVVGTSDADTLVGTRGNDSINGAKGNDVLDGADGHDTLWGGDGEDRVHGGQGDDVLYGLAGKDTLDGGSGNDVLYGGHGIDTLVMSAGHDLLYGGSHNDTFIFDARISGTGVIKDFEAGDRIKLQHLQQDLGENGKVLFKFGDYVMLQDSKDGVTVSVDIDGGAATRSFEHVLLIEDFHDIAAVRTIIMLDAKTFEY